MKRKILLNWPYYREDWIKPFRQLSSEIDFIFLSNTSQSESEVKEGLTVLYWDQFTGASEIIEKINPDAVVFISIDSGYSISLNLACQKHSIKSIILQHGLFHNYTFYRSLEKLNRISKPESKSISGNGRNNMTLKFLLKSLSVSQLIHFPFIILFIIVARRFGSNLSQKIFNLSWRKADQYICYTKFNAAIYTERDRIPEPKLLEVGNPAYDIYFHLRQKITEENYYLLIDQPLASNPFNNFGISKNQMAEFYRKINVFAEKDKCRLIIKLHPESYNDEPIFLDKNIEYVRNSDLPNLILRSKGCFGTFSTAMIPALLYKKCILFQILNSSTQLNIINLNMAGLLDFHTFQSTDIDFNQHNSSDIDKEIFMKQYFYKNDGKAIERLSSILKDQSL